MAERASTSKLVAAVTMTAALGVVSAILARAQEVTFTGRVVMTQESARTMIASPANAVVWLMPLGASSVQPTRVSAEASPRRLRLSQKNKRFDPHLLVVPVGSMVDFPNNDPLFHNVFSLFEGKRFDLGLYEAGSTRGVAFDRPGICYIFCNIHPEMSAVVIVLATPYHATANESGTVSIPNVPAGRYRLQVWHERCTPEYLNQLTREITISPENPSLGTLQLVEAAVLPLSHKNKYGRDYDAPTPRGPLYSQP